VTKGTVRQLDPAEYGDLSGDLADIALGFEAAGNRVASMRLTVGFEDGSELTMEMRKPDGGDGDPAEG
jgi:hypothetical protein